MGTFFHRSSGHSGTSGPAARYASKTIAEEQPLYEYALASLGRRMRTEAELKRLLRQRVGDAENGAALIDAVVERLKSHQFLSDARYAAAYSSLRKEGRGLGQRRVARDLLQKGVCPEVVAREVEAAYQDTDEETQARAYLLRKRIEKPAAGDERARARVFRLLARAGFDPGVTLAILRSWDGQPKELED